MGKVLERLIKQFKDNREKFFDLSTDNNYEKSVENIIEYSIAKDHMTDISRLILNQMKKEMGKKEFLIFMMEKLVGLSVVEETYDNLLFNFKTFLNDKQKELVEPFAHGKTNKEKAKIIIDFLNSDVLDKKVFDETVDNMILAFMTHLHSINEIKDMAQLDQVLPLLSVKNEEAIDVEISSFIGKDAKPFEVDYEKEIDEFIESNKNGVNDKELEKALIGSKSIFTNFKKDKGLVGYLGEKTGKISCSLFLKEQEKYLNENNILNFKCLAGNNRKEKEISDNYQANFKGEYTASDKFREVLKESFELFDSIGFDGASITDIFLKDNEDLINAIKNKDVENTKKFYNINQEKIALIDRVIKINKEINPEHYFNENQTVARTVIYPAKFRVDFEGATLANQAAYLHSFCKKNNIELDDLLNDPINIVNNLFKEKCEGKKSPLTTLLNDNDNKFISLYNLLQKDDIIDFELTRDTTLFTNSIVQLAPAMTMINDKNRFESTHALEMSYNANLIISDRNFEKASSYFLDGNKLVNETLPIALLTKDDFDPFTMFSTKEKPMMDYDTKLLKEPFDIKDYLRNLSTEELVDRFQDIMKDYNNVMKKPKSNEPVEHYKNIKNTCANYVKEALLERTSNREVVEECMNNLANGDSKNTKLANSSRAKLITSIIASEGINKDNYGSLLQETCRLQHEYDKHLGITKLFSSELRNQKKILNDMKAKLQIEGITKKEIDEVVKKGYENEELFDDFNLKVSTLLIEQEIVKEGNELASRKLKIDDKVFVDSLSANNDSPVEEIAPVEKELNK